tara:strand:- start:798 stop:1478 length:681 start_codon:yes stop_codon:yes gene_type:complete
MKKTVEKQYMDHVRYKEKYGDNKLGIARSYNWEDDPKRLLFELSRYKFVSKMLSGKKNVLEIGCGDGFCSRIILQEVSKLHAVDIDPIFIEDAKKNMKKNWPIRYEVRDILNSSVKKLFEAAFALDVFEHISKKDENKFIKNIINSLKKNGILIIGTPSLESQKYASKGSKIGHVNCKSGKELQYLMQEYFHNVFMFSMNDEIVHTGFQQMAHYLFALCVGIKNKS